MISVGHMVYNLVQWQGIRVSADVFSHPRRNFDEIVKYKPSPDVNHFAASSLAL
jgi:hypothetical protein